MNHNLHLVTLTEYPDSVGTMPIAVDMPLSSRSSTSSSRRVHFGSDQTRYYERILGDHPLCSDGLPLTYGWTFHEDECVRGSNDSPSSCNNDDCYTVPTLRILGRGRQRTRVPRMTILTRMSILLDSGVSEEEIVRHIHKFHKNSRRTYRKQQCERLWSGMVKMRERTLQSLRYYVCH